MWGGFTDQTLLCPRHIDPVVVGHRTHCKSSACRLAWVNVTLGHYWFAHKMKAWWTRFNAEQLGVGRSHSSCLAVDLGSGAMVSGGAGAAAARDRSVR